MTGPQTCQVPAIVSWCLADRGYWQTRCYGETVRGRMSNCRYYYTVAQVRAQTRMLVAIVTSYLLANTVNVFVQALESKYLLNYTTDYQRTILSDLVRCRII